MEKKIKSRREWIVPNTIKKQYSKRFIWIRNFENNGKMPVLYGKEMEEMSWRNTDDKQVGYSYEFKFENRMEANKFLYGLAYDTMSKGVLLKKDSKTSTNISDYVSLTNVSTINNIPYSFVIDLYLQQFNDKSCKVELSVGILQ